MSGLSSSDVTEMAALQTAQRRWAEGAQRQLQDLADPVAELRRALETPSAPEAVQGKRLTAAVHDACGALTLWLHTSRAPRGLRKAEGELGATAGVYRNAAVAFGSLPGAEPEQFEARYKACARLLHQGDDHIEVLQALLRKKLTA